MVDDTAREDDHEGERIADEVAAAIVDKFPGSVAVDSHGQPVVYVDRTALADVARFLRDEQDFTMCVDITAVDHLLSGTRHGPPGVER